MIIETIFEQGEAVKEKHTNFQGKVVAVESKMTGIEKVDKASQCYLVEKDVYSLKERHWIRADRLERIEDDKD